MIQFFVLSCGQYVSLQKHEGCFNQLLLHQLQCAWDNNIFEAHIEAFK